MGRSPYSTLQTLSFRESEAPDLILQTQCEPYHTKSDYDGLRMTVAGGR
jgi:hypothetical protein